MAKKQHYMSWEERNQLEALSKAKLPVSQIAKQLGCCRQTIYNELARGKCQVVRNIHGIDRDVEEYSAQKAQLAHNYNQTAKGRPLKIGSDHAYAAFLERKMLGIQENGETDPRKRYSPGAALAAARQAGFTTSVCVNTLYSYIDSKVFLTIRNKDLIVKGKRKKKGARPERRRPHPQLPSITERPEHINERKEPGHKEIDLVVGAQGTSGAVLTMLDRLTRLLYCCKLPDKKAASVRAALDRIEKDMGKRRFRDAFRSITTDNGSEFLEYEQLTKSVFKGQRFTVYYCHSYSAWEKGSNENANRLLRRFFPKGTDFTAVSQREINEAADWLNQYPRKLLGWKSAAEYASGLAFASGEASGGRDGRSPPC